MSAPIVVVEEIVQEAIVQPGIRRTVIVQPAPPTEVIVESDDKSTIVVQDRVGSVLVRNIVAVDREDAFSDILMQQDCHKGDPITTMGFVVDSNNPVRDFARVAGIALADAASGTIVQVQTDGSIKNATWSWTRGQDIFVNGTVLSMVPPTSGFAAVMGNASASDTIVMNIVQIAF